MWTRVPKNNEGDEIYYEVNNKEVRLQDSRWYSLSQYSRETFMTFDILETGSRATKYGSGRGQVLSFEMNLDLRTAERDVYNALDWVRTLGGF